MKMRSSRLVSKQKQIGKAHGAETALIKQCSPNGSETGFLLFNGALKPLYMNTRAAQILFYPDNPSKMKGFTDQLAARIRAVLPNGESAGHASPSKEFLSGRRHYICQLFDVHVPGSGSRGSTLALLLERSARGAAETLCEQYHLTPRETEAVRLLVLGLASKEIAARMGISPNTVKVFLRLAMGKMGVSSRSGIMSKFINLRPKSV